MKKQYLLIGLMVTALGFTACDEDFTDWAEPQSNPQEDIVGQIQASFVKGANANIVMDNITKDSVAIATFQSLSMGEATFTPTSLTIDGKTFPYSYSNGNYKVKVSELDSLAQVTYMSRAAYPRELKVKVKGAAILNEQSLSVESDEMSITITPATPLAIDPNGYNLLSDFTNWGDGAPMEKISDYIYQYTFDNTEGNSYWFKIRLGSYTSADWGDGQIIGSVVDGDNSSKILAVWENAQAPMTNIKGETIIQLDVENYVITVSKVVYNIFVPGNHQGWSPATAPMLCGTDNKGEFRGYSYLNGDFKFTNARDWDNGEFNSGHFTNYVGNAAPSTDGSNITCTAEGFYQIVANTNDGTLTLNETTTWGIIGPGQPGGWDSDTNMNYNKAEDCWEATLDLAADMIKFRANDGWDINVGGSFDDLTEGGADIAVPEAGTYVVKLYLSRTTSDNMYCTLTKQ